MTFRFAIAALFAVTATTPALAHLDPAEHGSFAAGFTHPVFGLDHVLAMIAVGLWAALIGGRAIWTLPSTFVGAMIVGFGLSLAGLSLPYVEPAILASVVIFGCAVALALRLPTALSTGLIALFGLCHGHAHGGEMGEAGLLGYAAGFVLATALLHATGVLVGYGAQTAAGNNRSTARAIIRALGAATAAFGVVLAIG